MIRDKLPSASNEARAKNLTTEENTATFSFKRKEDAEKMQHLVQFKYDQHSKAIDSDRTDSPLIYLSLPSNYSKKLGVLYSFECVFFRGKSLEKLKEQREIFEEIFVWIIKNDLYHLFSQLPLDWKTTWIGI